MPHRRGSHLWNQAQLRSPCPSSTSRHATCLTLEPPPRRCEQYRMAVCRWGGPPAARRALAGPSASDSTAMTEPGEPRREED